MKQLIFGLAISALSFTACNNSTDTKTADTSGTHDSTQHKALPASGTAATDVSNQFKNVFTHYLHLKNALVDDKNKDAAVAAKELDAALQAVDKAGFTADQSRTYSDIEADIKEHAEHIAANTGNIKHQREHFDLLSKDVYDIAKTFGAGQTLYKDYCPMYNNKKGAIWLSETKDIKNPYYGTEMLTCGEMQEELK